MQEDGELLTVVMVIRLLSERNRDPGTIDESVDLIGW
jgi:hypothetical protein